MRILILANMDAGLFKFRKELIERIANENSVYFSVPNGEYVQKIINLGCEYIQCNKLDRRSKNPFKDFELLVYYKRVITDINPDVVLTYTIKPNVYGGIVCSMLRVPYIANITGLGTAIENGGLLSGITMSLYKLGLKCASCVFFQNRSNQKLFIDRRLVRVRTRVIPGSGVNTEDYKYERYPSDDEGIRFLFVGRIMKDKGIDELLLAFSKLQKKHPKVYLDIVGFCDEDYLDILHNAETNGNLVFHGFQQDIHPFYNKCHCAVLPSYHEGTANVMLEASASGRPVITTRVPGCQETFDEGLTGFGCEAKSAKSLYAAMVKFMSLPNEQRKQMGRAARDKMIKEYDRNLVLQAYLEEIGKTKRR